MNHAVWCSLHQRPGLQDFLQRLISGHSTHGVADIASCSLSADPLLAAQSVGAIDTDNFDPANKSSKLVSRGLSQKYLNKLMVFLESCTPPPTHRSLQRLELRKRRCVQVHRFRSPTLARNRLLSQCNTGQLWRRRAEKKVNTNTEVLLSFAQRTHLKNTMHPYNSTELVLSVSCKHSTTPRQKIKELYT